MKLKFAIAVLATTTLVGIDSFATASINSIPSDDKPVKPAPRLEDLESVDSREDIKDSDSIPSDDKPVKPAPRLDDLESFNSAEEGITLPNPKGNGETLDLSGTLEESTTQLHLGIPKDILNTEQTKAILTRIAEDRMIAEKEANQNSDNRSVSSRGSGLELNEALTSAMGALSITSTKIEPSFDAPHSPILEDLGNLAENVANNALSPVAADEVKAFRDEGIYVSDLPLQPNRLSTNLSDLDTRASLIIQPGDGQANEYEHVAPQAPSTEVVDLLLISPGSEARIESSLDVDRPTTPPIGTIAQETTPDRNTVLTSVPVWRIDALDLAGQTAAIESQNTRLQRSKSFGESTDIQFDFKPVVASEGTSERRNSDEENKTPELTPHPSTPKAQVRTLDEHKSPTFKDVLTTPPRPQTAKNVTPPVSPELEAKISELAQIGAKLHVAQMHLGHIGGHGVAEHSSTSVSSAHTPNPVTETNATSGQKKSTLSKQERKLNKAKKRAEVEAAKKQAKAKKRADAEAVAAANKAQEAVAPSSITGLVDPNAITLNPSVSATANPKAPTPADALEQLAYDFRPALSSTVVSSSDGTGAPQVYTSTTNISGSIETQTALPEVTTPLPVPSTSIESDTEATPEVIPAQAPTDEVVIAAPSTPVLSITEPTEITPLLDLSLPTELPGGTGTPHAPSTPHSTHGFGEGGAEPDHESADDVSVHTFEVDHMSDTESVRSSSPSEASIVESDLDDLGSSLSDISDAESVRSFEPIDIFEFEFDEEVAVVEPALKEEPVKPAIKDLKKPTPVVHKPHEAPTSPALAAAGSSDGAVYHPGDAARKAITEYYSKSKFKWKVAEIGDTITTKKPHIEEVHHELKALFEEKFIEEFAKDLAKGTLQEEKELELIRERLKAREIKDNQTISQIQHHAMQPAAATAILAEVAKVNDLRLTLDPVAVASGAEPCKSFSIWSAGLFGKSKQKGKTLEDSFKSNIQGGVLGAEVILENDHILGLTYSKTYAKKKYDNFSFADNKNVLGNIFSLYGMLKISDHANISSQIQYGNLRIKGKRTDKAIGDNFNSNTKGQVYGAKIALAKDLDKFSNLKITPKIGLSYLKAKLNPYSETGGVGSLTFHDNLTSEKLYVNVGVDVGQTFIKQDYVFSPTLYVRAEKLIHDKNNKPRVSSALFVSLDPSAISYSSNKDITYHVGTRLSVFNNKSSELTVGYECSMGKKYLGHTGAIKLKIDL